VSPIFTHSLSQRKAEASKGTQNKSNKIKKINGLKVKVFIEIKPSTLQNYTYQEIILFLTV